MIAIIIAAIVGFIAGFLVFHNNQDASNKVVDKAQEEVGKIEKQTGA